MGRDGRIVGGIATMSTRAARGLRSAICEYYMRSSRDEQRPTAIWIGSLHWTGLPPCANTGGRECSLVPTRGGDGHVAIAEDVVTLC